jgi:hypothetical protein
MSELTLHVRGQLEKWRDTQAEPLLPPPPDSMRILLRGRDGTIDGKAWFMSAVSARMKHRDKVMMKNRDSTRMFAGTASATMVTLIEEQLA